MTPRKSRLGIVGVLTLVAALMVGLMSGSVADAKKKKKKAAGSVTVSKTTPTAIPAGTAPTPAAEGKAGQVDVPLTVGKKAKGKVVGWDSLTITTSWTGSANGALPPLFAELISPKGRTVNLVSPPPDGNTTAAGPITETPDSPVGFCVNDPGPPPNPPCFFGDNTLSQPYNGTVGNTSLAFFGGVGAKGTWIVRVFNASSTTTGTLNSVTLSMSLKTAPV